MCINWFPILVFDNGSQNFINLSFPPEAIKDLEVCQSIHVASLPWFPNIYSYVNYSKSHNITCLSSWQLANLASVELNVKPLVLSWQGEFAIKLSFISQFNPSLLNFISPFLSPVKNPQCLYEFINANIGDSCILNDVWFYSSISKLSKFIICT